MAIGDESSSSSTVSSIGTSEDVQSFNSVHDNPNLKITSQLLDGLNHVRWAQSVKLFVGGRGKIGFLLGTEKEPAKSDPKYAKWFSDDSMVRTWLINSMQSTISVGYLFTNNTHLIWESLRKICVSSIDPNTFPAAVEAGALMVEIGNYDSFYDMGILFSPKQLNALLEKTMLVIGNFAFVGSEIGNSAEETGAVVLTSPVDTLLRDRYRQCPLGSPPCPPRHPYATTWQDDEYSSDFEKEQRPQPHRKGKGTDNEALAKAIAEQTHDIHLKVPEFDGKSDADACIEWLDKCPTGKAYIRLPSHYGVVENAERVEREILRLAKETKRILPSVALSVTVPHTLSLPDQVTLAEMLEEEGVDIIQTEGGKCSNPSNSGVLGLIEKVIQSNE
ncbi:hypothetical protein GIB67_031736 [Kingdonia uniflora]|uniref:Uncharacterized protein ycf23 n=1 Tax=Kingdonia uniflora TaxID=39325 RepID=A0A7J7NK13_9MAGN|nr:hypothetical protein GIB67_031736 [Kingdonia uniflora]